MKKEPRRKPKRNKTEQKNAEMRNKRVNRQENQPKESKHKKNLDQKASREGPLWGDFIDQDVGAESNEGGKDSKKLKLRTMAWSWSKSPGKNDFSKELRAQFLTKRIPLNHCHK